MKYTDEELRLAPRVAEIMGLVSYEKAQRMPTLEQCLDWLEEQKWGAIYLHRPRPGASWFCHVARAEVVNVKGTGRFVLNEKEGRGDTKREAAYRAVIAVVEGK